DELELIALLRAPDLLLDLATLLAEPALREPDRVRGQEQDPMLLHRPLSLECHTAHAGLEQRRSSAAPLGAAFRCTPPRARAGNTSRFRLDRKSTRLNSSHQI